MIIIFVDGICQAIGDGLVAFVAYELEDAMLALHIPMISSEEMWTREVTEEQVNDEFHCPPRNN